MTKIKEPRPNESYFGWEEGSITFIDEPVTRGGPGSGHFEHEGRPGQVGGSLPSKSIKDLLHVPRTKRWDDIRVALDAIDHVHVMDDSMEPLPLKASKSYKTGGMYRYKLRTGWQLDMFVVLREWGEEDTEVQSNMLHETGHWIDHMMMGVPRRFASPEYVTHELSTPDAEAIANWRKVVKESDAMKELLEFPGGSVDVEYTHEGIQGFASYYYGFNFLRKASSWKETFARSYAQWVAYKSDDQGLRSYYDKRLTEIVGGAAPLTWEWDDFQPVADAMDDIFRSRGWLNE